MAINSPASLPGITKPNTACGNIHLNLFRKIAVVAQTSKVAISLDHDVLLQSSTRRELGVEDLVQLLESTTTGLNTEEPPDEGIDEVKADKDEVVAPVDGFESNGGNIGVVEVGAVGHDDVL